MAKTKWIALSMLVALSVALLALGGIASAQQDPGKSLNAASDAPGSTPNQRLVVDGPGSSTQGALSEAQKRIKSQGYLVPDQRAYEQAKASATREAAAKQATGAATPAAATTAPPQTFRSWEGLRDRRWTPSDSTGSIGPTRYIELVNTKYGIYDRAGHPEATGGLRDLVGVNSDFPLTDPQVIWDATTGRFYYVVLDLASATDNRLLFGFSKTASPSSPADFCKYSVRYGSRLPDYPKLGDTEGLLLIGANSFVPAGQNGYRYVGSDLVSITKPHSGTTCPARKTFAVDAEQDLKGADGLRAFTPVPANQIDTRNAGHVVAVSNALYRNGQANLLNIYKVDENRDGSMRLSQAKGLQVPSYKIPASAPQPNTNHVLDTLDGRNTQAVQAFDPSPGRIALWTQQTVFGGSGAEVRWYEIDLTFPFPSVLQRGTLGDLDGDFFFNAAISPDREANGTTRRFGDAMVMGYNTSSKSHHPDIRMVSKVGSGPTSNQALVKSSPRSMVGHSCEVIQLSLCRWGDYSAATPDPLVPGDPNTGRVWLSNQWVKFRGGSGPGQNAWSTWNWAATP